MKMKQVQSTCNYCALDCNMDFYVEDGRIVKVLPTKGYPVNDGFAASRVCPWTNSRPWSRPLRCRRSARRTAP